MSNDHASIPLLARDDYMSPSDLAALLGVSAKTLANWRCQRQGPEFFRAGRKIWYPRERVRAWILARLKNSLNVHSHFIK